jgi:hypothetical protein
VNILETHWGLDGDYEFVKKFREAEHFYNQMRSTANALNLNALQHNVSAFVAAARAVTMVMKAQYGKEEWYKNWAVVMDSEIKNDRAFKFLNDKRIETLHVKQSDVSASESFRFDPPLVAGVEVNGKMVMEHTVTMEIKDGVLRVTDIDGDPNPQNVLTSVQFSFEGTNVEVFTFGRYIMNHIVKYARELSALLKAKSPADSA